MAKKISDLLAEQSFDDADSFVFSDVSAGADKRITGESFRKDFTNDFINVRRFGAVGDGFNDDTPAIIEAIEAARDGELKNVLIPKGTFSVTGNIQIPSNVTIFGMGYESEVKLINDSQLNRITINEIKNGTRPLGFIFINDQTESVSERVIISNLKVNGNSESLSTTSQSFSCIHFNNASDCHLYNVYSTSANRNLTQNDIDNQYRSFSASFSNSFNCTIRGGVYEDAGYENIGVRGGCDSIKFLPGTIVRKTADYGRHGIQVSDEPFSTNITAMGVIFDGPSIKFINHSCRYVDIIGCTFRNVSTGVMINYIDGASDGLIANNRCIADPGNSSHGILLDSIGSKAQKNIRIVGNQVQSRFISIFCIDTLNLLIHGNSCRSLTLEAIRVRKGSFETKNINISNNPSIRSRISMTESQGTHGISLKDVSKAVITNNIFPEINENAIDLDTVTSAYIELNNFDVVNGSNINQVNSSNINERLNF